MFDEFVNRNKTFFNEVWVYTIQGTQRGPGNFLLSKDSIMRHHIILEVKCDNRGLMGFCKLRRIIDIVGSFGDIPIRKVDSP